ncbi:MAG: deoxyribodipyrimidine photo-lyase [Vicinamibacterales bacterium]
MKPRPVLVWFRLDLRLHDNPALLAAVARGGPVVPVFVWSPDEEAPWAPGSASRWWLHHSLNALAKDMEPLGTSLVLRKGSSEDVLLDLAEETGADAVFWNRRYEPALVARDTTIKARCQSKGLIATSFNSALLFEPWEVKTKAGGPFQVFTPFWKACLARHTQLGHPQSAPPHLTPVRGPLASMELDELRLLPRHSWADGFADQWRPGETGARARLSRFVEQALSQYPDGRDRPDRSDTSRLSPHLHFGEISPRAVWQEIAKTLHPRAAECFLRELGWREFAHHLLFHFPHTPAQPLKPVFERFPWADQPAATRAWQRGRTGFPIVDAGMRELWHTGWMHNRVRMVVASFLVKDLLVSWQEGARWFWDTLVDADLANNTLGWQWTAGCGADAAPFFRIFNPASQASRFDPDADYVRRWIPEFGTATYPEPIVDHQEARDRALLAYRQLNAV